MGTKIPIFGISAIFVAGSDGIEEQIKAAQDATLNSKLTLAELRGDDSLLPLVLTAKTLDVDVKGKNGQLSMRGLQILNGGTLVTTNADGLTAPLQETVDSTMFTALGTPITGGTPPKVTDSWLFTALSPTTYQITRGSTGAVTGPLTTSATANTTAIPGVSFTVATTPALVAGSMASFMTAAPTTGLIETLDVGPSDFGPSVRLRVITEPTQLGRFEFTFYKAISMGVVMPTKHKEFLLADFEFRVVAGDQTGKAWRWKRLVS